MDELRLLAAGLVVGGGVTLAAAFVLALAFFGREFRILRDRHADVYRELGSPRVFSRSIKQHRNDLDELTLGDPELDAAKRRRQRLGPVVWGSVLAMLIGVAASRILRIVAEFG